MSKKNKVDANPDGGDDKDNTSKQRGAGNAGGGDDGARPGGTRRDTSKQRGAGNAGPADEHRGARPGNDQHEPGKPGSPAGPGGAGRSPAGYVVDRIEAGYAVLIAEDGGATVDEPVGHLPGDAGEGSYLLRGEDGSFIVDHACTAERRAEARARLSGLRKRSRRKG